MRSYCAYQYRKAGVLLTGIAKFGFRQQDLFSVASPTKEDKPLMAALDLINEKYGRRAIQFGMTAGGDKQWVMTQTQKSQAYTTSWQKLPVAKATG